MISKVMAGMKPGQKDICSLDTDSASLEASKHADAMQTGGPEKPEEDKKLQCKLRLQSKLKLMLKLT